MSAPENPLSESPAPVVPEIPSVPVQPTARPVEDPSWNLWDVAALAVITLAAVMGCLLALAYFVHRRFMPGAPWADALKRPEVIVGGQLLAYFLVLFLMYGMLRTQSRGNILAAIRWNWPRNWTGYLLAGLVLDICLLPLAYLLPMPQHAPIDEFFRTAHDAYVLSLFGIFFAPLFEEIFFRGFLYPALARRFGMYISIVLTAVGFAAIHAPQLREAWGPVLVIFLVGLALTTVRALKKSVAATVLMHMAYNATIFVGAYAATDGFRHMEKFNQ